MKLGPLSVFAKMLARENISLKVANVKTAFVDLISRQVTIPNWSFESDDLKKMFIGHECAHCIFTPTANYAKNLARVGSDQDQQKNFALYMNVVDDCRIDRLIIARYPGLKKHYIEGSRELMRGDFFNLKKRTVPLEESRLIDRINVFFKIRHGQDASWIPFSTEEQDIVNRIESITNYDDVVDIAYEIWELDKQNQSEVEAQNDVKREGEGEGEGDGEGEEEDDDLPKRMNIDEELFNGKPKKEEKGNTKKVYAPSTYLAEETRKRENAEKNASNIAISYRPTAASTIVKKINPQDVINTTFMEEIRDLDSLRREYKSYISNFCSAFERKQQARAFERVREEKLGTLDMNRIYRYLFDDQIFKQNELTFNNKNHAFAFLIDCSSSMSYVYQKVIEQFYVLTQICERLNVPCIGFGFSDNYRPPKTVDTFGVHGYASLLSFYDSRFNRQKNNETLGAAFNVHLGGTPLASSLYYMVSVLEDFRSRNPGVDVVNFIVLTDGGDGTGNVSSHLIHGRTNAMFEAGDSPRQVVDNTKALYEMIRECLGVRITYIDITESTSIGSSHDFSRNGFALEKNIGGVDNAIFVQPSLIQSSEKRLIKILVDCFK